MPTATSARDLPLDRVLQIRLLTKTFPGVTALRQVHFELHSGSIHALLGENGAGKSTLIKVIAGIEQPDSGEIILRGKPIVITSPQEAMNLGIAVIHQELSLFPDLSVAENVFMGRIPRRGVLRLLDWQTLNANTDELFRSMSVKIDPRRTVGELTLAQRQLVEIACALSQNAKILVMDEPTASLSETEVEHLFSIIRRLRDSGGAIVFISHRIEEVLEIADTITVLRDGNYVGTRGVSETNRDELVQMMVGRSINALFPKEEARIGDPVLRFRHFHKEATLRETSLELKRGEIVGLAGLVGAGRTELAETIIGIRRSENSETSIEGRRGRIRGPEEALRLGIVYVPEDRTKHGVIGQMSVKENTTLAVLRSLSRLVFTSSQSERSMTEELVRRLDIRAASISTQVANLSGGNQQKVVLGKFLAAKPKVLILDEPTRGVDVGAKREIHRIVCELAGQGLAILLISSELPEILGMSDRILVMKEGKIVAEMARVDATQEKILNLAM